MRGLLLSLALIALFSATGCSALSTWLAEMAASRTGAGHTRQEMMDEYNSEVQAVDDMNDGC